MNVVNLIGRLVKEADIRRTQSGGQVATFTLAVSRRSKQDGQPDADFINCVAWNKTAEILDKYTKKGSQIGVEGRIQTRNYENQQGQRVYVTEVIVNGVQLLDPKSSEQAQPVNAYGMQVPTMTTRQPSLTEQAERAAFNIDSGDLPF